MKDRSVGRAQLKPPTPLQRVGEFDEDREVVGGLKLGDNSAVTTYTYMNSLPSSSWKLEQTLEDAKRTLEQEKMLVPDVEEEDRIDETKESKNSSDAEFMGIRSNPDLSVRYEINDGTTKASRSKLTKNSRKRDDTLAEAIMRALGEENEVVDSHKHFITRDASTFYSDDDLINCSSRIMSGSSYSENTDNSAEEDATLDETLLSGLGSNFTGVTSTSSAVSGTFAEEFQKLLKGKYYHCRDDGTLDETVTLDETLLSGFTEDTPNFQSRFMCASRPKKKQEHTQRKYRVESDKSVISEPSYLEYDAYDDNVSYDDNTFSTRGTVGVVQDIFMCGYLCGGDGKKHKPKEDSTVATQQTRGSRVSTSTPVTVKERLDRIESKKVMTDDAMETTPKKENVKNDNVCQESEDAGVVAETLDDVFWEGDGVFTSDASATVPTGIGAKRSVYLDFAEVEDGGTETSTQYQIPSDNMNNLLPASVQAAPQEDPKFDEKSFSATSEASIASSTLKKKPHLLTVVRSFSKSVSFRKQRSSATQQLLLEVSVDDNQTTSSLPKHYAESDVDTVKASGQQGDRHTMSQSESQGYEVPRQKSFRKMLRSRSSRRSLQHRSVVKSPTSPSRTVDASISTDSSNTDTELNAIAATQDWKSTIDKSTGKTYFYNKLTREVRWEAPEGFEQERLASPVWKAAYDTTTGRTYYYNRYTKAVTWKKPFELISN